MNKVWVVEMENDGEYEPCASASLSEFEANEKRKDWERNNPDNKFRVHPYFSEEDKQ